MCELSGEFYFTMFGVTSCAE